MSKFNEKIEKVDKISSNPPSNTGLDVITNKTHPDKIDEIEKEIEKEGIKIKENDFLDIAGNEIKQSGYKIDWLSIVIPLERNQIEPIIMQDIRYYLSKLDFKLGEFEPAPPRNFYNSGLSLSRRVLVLYNQADKEIIKGSSASINIIFTGVGCIDFYNRMKKKHGENADITGEMFKAILDLSPSVKVTRLDIAFDDFDGDLLNLELMCDKLQNKEYKSSKKNYRVIREKTVDGAEDTGLTYYLGSRQSGSYMLRAYSKRLQYLKKRQKLPEIAIKSGVWNRYEFEFKSEHAIAKIKEYLETKDIDKIFKSTMKDCVTWLEPKEIHKRYWEVSDWWTKYLENSSNYKFESYQRDPDLLNMLSWLSNNVINTIHVLEEVFKMQGLDFYEALREYKKEEERSKKHQYVIDEAKGLSREEMEIIIRNFKAGAYSKKYSKNTIFIDNTGVYND